MGVGNELLGDDGVGPFIADRFNAPGWKTLSCGTAPENFTSVIRHSSPELVVIIDAAEMGLPAGTARVIREQDIEDVSIGTHQQPLSLLIAYLRGFTGEVILIGIQPVGTIPGDPLSQPVKEAADEIMQIIREEKVREIPVYRQGDRGGHGGIG